MSERDLELVESVNPQQRVIHLERSIAFLRAQHHEVLTSLHTEVEKLKRRNKGRDRMSIKVYFKRSSTNSALNS